MLNQLSAGSAEELLRPLVTPDVRELPVQDKLHCRLLQTLSTVFQAEQLNTNAAAAGLVSALAEQFVPHQMVTVPEVGTGRRMYARVVRSSGGHFVVQTGSQHQVMVAKSNMQPLAAGTQVQILHSVARPDVVKATGIVQCLDPVVAGHVHVLVNLGVNVVQMSVSTNVLTVFTAYVPTATA